MSDPDQADEDKGFLARWSQRKHAAKQSDRDAPTANPDTPCGPVAEGNAEREFDLSSLPKLEDMTATTDITAFLRKGVPEHLRNAALRKSWALDPAIRNYVNPALEYAYDWNTPGGVPGSSEIGAEMDVARLVSQIMGTGESAVEPPALAVDSGNGSAYGAAQSPTGDETHESGPVLPTQALRLGSETASLAQKPSNIAGDSGNEGEPVEASQQSGSAAPQQTVRRHGSAKPPV